MVLLCVDHSGILALHLSRDGRTDWQMVTQSLPPLPKARPRSRRDQTRREAEEGGADDFSAMGGESAGRGAVVDAWRDAFIRRRTSALVKGARSALAGREMDDLAGVRSMMRKKDTPDKGDRDGVRRFVAAQVEQANLVKRRLGKSKAQKLIAAAARPLEAGSLVWDAPSVPAYEYGLPACSGTPRCPRRRALFDGVASTTECQHAIGATLLGTDGLVDVDSAEYNGELSLVCSPPETVRSFLGEGAVRLVSLLLDRIQTALRGAFGESRQLFLAGALLSRLQPPPRRASADGASYEYSVAHVDRANVASYDYSAVLYLNNKGSGFDGGDFNFVDEGEDQLVEPRAGRCVLFSSGFEQLHRVCPVLAGNRFALAAWFTLTAAASDGPLAPSSHYEIHNPVPPSSVDDDEAAQVNLDTLRAAIERKFGGG